LRRLVKALWLWLGARAKWAFAAGVKDPQADATWGGVNHCEMRGFRFR